MELVKIKISNIIPYERNARKNDKAVDIVKKSIEQCEYVAPIILDEHYCDVIIDRWEKFTGLKAEKNIKEV